MRRMFRFSLAMAAFLAVGAVAQAQVKIGTLDMQKALLETAEMKKEQTTLEARYKPTQDRITKLQGEIAEIQKQLQTLGDKMKPEAQQTMVADGTKKQRDLQRLTEDLQADVERDRNDILQRGRTRIEASVNKVAEEKGLDMVIDAGSLFFSKPGFDISKDVTAAYDKAYPVK
jgi:outer membrane protein